ncbi:MAG TPA: carboxypeptidase-like regulatory domain-containing protein, partial [Planctomycetota bacterium]|nr:carboxypeptidase-like regulatory domain-containing protein [Planctomycetota bacterium]
MESGRSRTPAVLLAAGVLLVLCLLLFLLAPDGPPDPVSHNPATAPVAVPAAPAPPPTAAAPAPAAPPAAPPPAAPATNGAIAGSALRLDGAPAPGARVRAAPGGDESKRKFATAGDDGAFRFEGLEPGSWSLACGGGGYGTRLDEGARDVVVEVVAGAEVRVEVRGQALAHVSGRVVGPDGKPIPKAAVTLQCDAFLSPTGGVWRISSTTNEDGSYEFASASPGDSAMVQVVADGFGAVQRWLHDLASGSRTVVDFTLEPARTLELLLVAADDGTPVREAIVWVKDAASGDLYEGPHGDAFRPDEQGRVRAPGLRDAAIELQIEAKGFAWTQEKLAAPSALAGPATIRLVRAVSISGRLLHANGTAARGETVRAIPVGETDPLAPFKLDHDGTTADDGSFTIEGVR